MGQRRMTVGTAGLTFHVMNRGVRRSQLFDSDTDYQSCLIVLAAAFARYPATLLAYCLMPNHFHLVVSPTADGQMSKLMQWFTATHSRRWHLRNGTRGTGAVYQGRFKAFVVQEDDHFLTVCRYVERNPLRAKLVTRAEDWPWSSLADRARPFQVLNAAPWPVDRPPNWRDLVNNSESVHDTHRIRRSLATGVPFGSAFWSERVAATLQVRPTSRSYKPT